MELLRREVRLLQVVKLVGPDALPDGQRFIIDVCSLFKNAFLQQNAFDDIDRYSSAEKQSRMLAIILVYWQRGAQAIKRGVPLSDLKRLKVIQEVNKMKFSYADDQLDELDRLSARLERAVDRLEEDHA